MFQTWLKQHDLRDITFLPRIFPSASDRAFWEKHTTEAQIRNAEALLGYEWPLIRASQYMEFHRSGNRLAQEDPHFARRRALITLFFGEVAENKGRFLPDLCDGLFLICEETYWGLSAHSAPTRSGDTIPNAADPHLDLFSAQTAENVAMIYHILGDSIRKYCPRLMDRIEYEMDRRIIQPYLNHADYWWMGYGSKNVNNWNPWILSNLLIAWLTTDQRRSVVERGIQKMLKEINVYYRVMPEDGGCDEGPDYWTVAGAKLFLFCKTLYDASAGAIDFFGDEKLKRIGRYMTAANIRGRRAANFADCPSLFGGNLDAGAYGFGKAIRDEGLCRLGATLRRLRGSWQQCNTVYESVLSLIYTEEMEQVGDFVPEECYVLPNLQTAYVRAGNWYYAAKGGHNNESHNHNDVGSFMVYYDGAPVLVDPGCGVYTKDTFSGRRYTIWTMQSGWHNLPLFNQTEQMNGKQFCADRFEVAEKTTHVSFADAYPKEAGLSAAERRISICEDGVSWVDSFRFSRDGNSFEEHVITLLTPTPTEGGVLLGDKFFLRTDLPVRVERKEFEGDPKLCRPWGQDHLYRLSFSAHCGAEAEVRFSLEQIR
ncbi:MAG: heparinase II/III family protein [Clostridia bacterium]|nr:heparinase II/III family protein [Clostridia bacterium]